MFTATMLTVVLLALRLFSLQALAAPAPVAVPEPAPQSLDADLLVTNPASSFWMAAIARQGSPAFGPADHQVFRNVRDFGAKGDGVTDDTAAINAAIALGSRCGQGCDSSTTTPALVYFPAGVYVVSAPIVQLYYTQLVGDATNPPTLKASPAFTGIAVIDSNPYDSNGNNFWTNQNNFFRQVRNFVIDLTALPFTTGTGIHWQVAQATSLQNIVFNMHTDGGDANAQQGIFMENGSGGFMSDLTFNGGRFGAFLGNQQFTTRNLTFNNCGTAIFMNWNWAWTFQGVSINNCGVGIDMSNGGATFQTVGSVLLLDSVISNTPIGVLTAFAASTQPEFQTNGTLILDNVDATVNVPSLVVNSVTRAVILPGNQRVATYVQGRVYDTTSGGSQLTSRPPLGAAVFANLGTAVQALQVQPATSRPAVLLDAETGRWLTRSRPQYEDIPLVSFKSVRAAGVRGDGVTDDTAALQLLFDSVSPGDVVFFDHGAYLVTSTVRVPANVRIVGEVWSVILAGGNSSFKDQTAPRPVFQIGQPGDIGTVEISDLIFETAGSQPGAILMEWNVAAANPASAAMWDVHFRVGGSAGTGLQSDRCAKQPTVAFPGIVGGPAALTNEECAGAFLLLHVTQSATLYAENCWFWTADHELDLPDHEQIDVFNGRGVLIESALGPVHLWGTASEHNVLYNYQFRGAANVFVGGMQTETPYFQGNPDSSTPFAVSAALGDPDFAASCNMLSSRACARSWGVRVVDSVDVWMYGAGLYSFFDNYEQTCLQTENCQDNMVSVETTADFLQNVSNNVALAAAALNPSGRVHVFGLSTKAAVNMISVEGVPIALDRENRNNFCATVGAFHG